MIWLVFEFVFSLACEFSLYVLGTFCTVLTNYLLVDALHTKTINTFMTYFYLLDVFSNQIKY
jgi:hypothetical protein